MLPIMSGWNPVCPPAPKLAIMTVSSTMYSGRSVAYAFSVTPLLVSDQTISLSPKSAGTVTLKTNWLRRGKKWVGWPRSGPPGSMWLSGPTGTSSSSSQLRL